MFIFLHLFGFLCFLIWSDMNFFIVVPFSFFVSWCLLKEIIPVLRVHLLEQLNERSSHSQPTPRGGGVAFVLVASVVSAINLLFKSPDFSSLLPLSLAPLIATPLAIVGFLDDRHSLSVNCRLVVQIITAIVVILLSSTLR